MTCPPCTHDCNEGRNCPTGKGKNMTQEALAQEQEPKIGCVNHDCEKCKAQKACVYCGQLVAKEKNNGV